MKSTTTSIIIVAHDRPEFLKAAIGSVLCQTNKKWELVVVDASHSPLKETVKRAVNGHSFLYKHLPGMAEWPPRCSEKWNYGVKMSSGDYVAFLDDDDQKCPDFVEKTSQILDRNPSVVFTVCLGWVIGADGERTGSFMGRPSIEVDMHRKIQTSFIVTGQLVVRRKVFDELRGFDERLPVSEDYEFNLRLFRKQGEIVNSVLSLHRNHEDKASQYPQAVEASQQALRYIIRKHQLADLRCRVCKKDEDGQMFVQGTATGWTFRCHTCQGD